MKGRGAWIWHLLNGAGIVGMADDVAGAVARCVAAKIDFVLIKAGIDGKPWAQFSAAAVTAFHAAGIRVYGWSYDTPGHEKAHADLILSCCLAGADGFCIDAEKEWEIGGSDALADAYHDAIDALGLPATFELSHAPFDVIAQHGSFPYTHLTRGCGAVLPQAYWSEHGMSEAGSTVRALDSWTRFRAQHPELTFDLLPSGYCVKPDSGCAGPTGVDVLDFEKRCWAAGCTGAAFWTLDRILPSCEAAMQAGSIWRGNA